MKEEHLIKLLNEEKDWNDDIIREDVKNKEIIIGCKAQNFLINKILWKVRE